MNKIIYILILLCLFPLLTGTTYIVLEDDEQVGTWDEEDGVDEIVYIDPEGEPIEAESLDLGKLERQWDDAEINRRPAPVPAQRMNQPRQQQNPAGQRNPAMPGGMGNFTSPNVPTGAAGNMQQGMGGNNSYPNQAGQGAVMNNPQAGGALPQQQYPAPMDNSGGNPMMNNAPQQTPAANQTWMIRGVVMDLLRLERIRGGILIFNAESGRSVEVEIAGDGRFQTKLPRLEQGMGWSVTSKPMDSYEPKVFVRRLGSFSRMPYQARLKLKDDQGQEELLIGDRPDLEIGFFPSNLTPEEQQDYERLQAAEPAVPMAAPF